MSDDKKQRMAEYMTDVAKINFKLQRSIYMKFKESLQYENLKMNEFYRVMIKALLDEDKRLLEMLDDYKRREEDVQTKRERFNIRDQRRKKEESKQTLSPDEVEKLYDFAEREHSFDEDNEED